LSVLDERETDLIIRAPHNATPRSGRCISLLQQRDLVADRLRICNSDSRSAFCNVPDYANEREGLTVHTHPCGLDDAPSNVLAPLDASFEQIANPHLRPQLRRKIGYVHAAQVDGVNAPKTVATTESGVADFMRVRPGAGQLGRQGRSRKLTPTTVANCHSILHDRRTSPLRVSESLKTVGRSISLLNSN
jgi:hypothetical protein